MKCVKMCGSKMKSDKTETREKKRGQMGDGLCFEQKNIYRLIQKKENGYISDKDQDYDHNQDQGI